MQDKYQRQIVILYSDAKPEYFPSEEQYITEAEVRLRAQSVARYFEKLDFKVSLLPGGGQVGHKLQQLKPDLVLNLVDSVRGQEYLAATIPGMLDLLNIPYIGTGTLGLAINSNKFLTKKLMEQAGLPLPRYQLFRSHIDPIDKQLKFPLISKLNEIHGSVAIGQESISESETHLRARIKNLVATYRQPILVEVFIVGKELTADLLEGAIKKIYIAEKVFSPTATTKYQIASFDAVWRNIDSYSYGRVEGHVALENYVRLAFDVLKMDDYAKFDVRQDESGRYYFIDSNANPALGPAETDCAIGHILKLYGIDFEEVVRRLLLNISKEETTAIG